MSDANTGPFVMRGARAAVATGLVHILEQVEGIERAIEENPGLAFDLARTLVESACRAVLEERSITYSRNEDLLRLFRSARDQLSFLPPTVTETRRTDESLKKTMGGLTTTIQGICELRNECGFASHGSGSQRPSMEAMQATLAAEAADAIVGFLYRVHREDLSRLHVTPLSFDHNPDFNEHLDDMFGPFAIGDIEFRPSEVLFELEPETYRALMAEFADTQDSEAQSLADERHSA